MIDLVSTERNREVFQFFNRQLVAALRSELERQGVRASGAAGNSLRPEYSPKRYRLLGAKHWEYIDAGRGSTRSPGDRQERIRRLFNWVGLKKYGIDFRTSSEQLSIAYAIAKVQDRKGSFRFRNPGARTNVVEASLQATLPGLRQKLLQVTSERIRSNIKTTFSNGNN